MIEQLNIESEISKLEKEVLSLKKSQPFYSGQFSCIRISTGNEYDLSFLATSTTTLYDVFLEYTIPNQPNPIFEPFIEVRSMPGNVLLDVLSFTYRVKHSVSTGGTVSCQINLTAFVQAGTELRVSIYAVTTDVGILSYGGSLRA